MDKIHNTHVPSISQSEADEILNPHYANLYSIFQSAQDQWDNLGKTNPEFRAQLGGRERSACLNKLIRTGIQEVYGYGRTPGVELIEKYGVLWLCVGNRIVMRAKKLDRRARHSNILTKNQLNLNLQLQIENMPPAASRLIVGYNWNFQMESMGNILVTLPNGRNPDWIIDVEKGTLTAMDQDIILRSTDNDEDSAGPIIKPKKIMPEEDQSNG